MFLLVEDFLTAAEVSAIADTARQAHFIDGRRTNPHNLTKNNTIADRDDPQVQKAAQIALAAFRRNEQARNFAQPKRIAAPQLVRYRAGMSYGAHVDAAFLDVGAQPLRSDVSCTIFINDPGSYEGGELVIHLGSEVLRVKGNTGQAILYPSTALHAVPEVTVGERLVMITFIESLIADQMQRELVYTLNEVRALEGLKMDWLNRVQLERVIANLQRMWSS
jgi:PKHD-type hydroxylase